MYHFVVRQKLRKAFRNINAGRYAPIVAQFSPRHHHRMYGHNALSGQRLRLASTELWYARLQRLLPDLRFKVRSIVVGGWPWSTVAMVAWDDEFSLPDGSRGSNQGVHEFELRWGKVHSMAVHCDTTRLEAYLNRMTELGQSEAGAAPIEDAAESKQ